MKNNELLKQLIKEMDRAVVFNTIIYDMKPVTPYYDYSIITSANTSRQAHAAVTYLRQAAEEVGLELRSYRDMPDAKWLLADLGTVVVHVFVGEERLRYNLDGLYCQLDRLEIK